MTACNRCGASAWHPEVRSCLNINCELRGHRAPKAGATAPGVTSLAPAAPHVVAPVPANDLPPVHMQGGTETEVRHHVR